MPLCIRCGETNAAHYVRLDTSGVICTPCLIEEVHDLRERVEQLTDALVATTALKGAASAAH